jgi:hypothetical protein
MTGAAALAAVLLSGGAARAHAQVSGCAATQQFSTGCERPGWSLEPEPGSLTTLPGLSGGAGAVGEAGSRLEPGGGLDYPPPASLVTPAVPPAGDARDDLNRRSLPLAIMPVLPMAPLLPILPGTGQP